MNLTTSARSLAVVGLLALGCSKDKSGDDQGGSGDDSAGGVTFESRTWHVGGLTVKGPVPAGWIEDERMGIFNKPKGGMYATRWWPSVTCEGSCSTIAENIKGAAARQLEANQQSYEKVELISDGVVDGGHEFEIEMTQKDGKKHRNWARFTYKEGWPKTFKILVMATDPAVIENMEAFKKAGRSFEVEPMPTK